jgi:hypothetical protein
LDLLDKLILPVGLIGYAFGNVVSWYSGNFLYPLQRQTVLLRDNPTGYLRVFSGVVFRNYEIDSFELT